MTTTFRTLHMPTRCRPATRERYEDLFRQGILDTFGSKRLDGSWSGDLHTYAAKLAAREVQSRPHLSLVRAVLRSAVEFGALDAMPEVPPLPKQSRKLPDAPSETDVATLLAEAKGWLRVAIVLGAFAGLRMGEVRAMEVRDVDFARSRILVRRALSADEVLPPKSGDERSVPFGPELRAVLTEATRLKLPTARIVVNGAGRTPTRQNVLTRFKALESRLGLREWSFHSLRHYFGTTILRRGGSVEAVRLLLGHSKLDVTQRYVHANAADLVAAIASLPGN